MSLNICYLTNGKKTFYIAINSGVTPREYLYVN